MGLDIVKFIIYKFCIWQAPPSPSLRELGETQTLKSVFLYLFLKTISLQKVAFNLKVCGCKVWSWGTRYLHKGPVLVEGGRGAR